jgi:hypothetical protein
MCRRSTPPTSSRPSGPSSSPGSMKSPSRRFPSRAETGSSSSSPRSRPRTSRSPLEGRAPTPARAMRDLGIRRLVGLVRLVPPFSPLPRATKTKKTNESRGLRSYSHFCLSAEVRHGPGLSCLSSPADVPFLDIVRHSHPLLRLNGSRSLIAAPPFSGRTDPSNLLWSLPPTLPPLLSRMLCIHSLPSCSFTFLTT